MIFLILDTNIWVYLANGYNPDKEKHEEYHFELLKQLKSLKHDKGVDILINDVVINEWNRNKRHVQSKIDLLKRKLEKPDDALKELTKYAKSNTDKLKEEYILGLIADIDANEKHIKEVEDFLLSDCLKIDITPDIKEMVLNLALENKAPFHNKRNNVADAMILFSADNYLQDKLFADHPSAIFVSNNWRDFTDGIEKDKFHPEIFKNLKAKDLDYERVLPKALNVSKEIIEEIQKHYTHELWLESISFNCMTPNCEGNENFQPWGYLDTNLPVKFSNAPIVNPNQLILFEEAEIGSVKIKLARIGNCVVCDTLHIECPSCSELFYVDEDFDKIQCPDCDTYMQIDKDEFGKECLFVVVAPDE
jgi:hypothetical protein